MQQKNNKENISNDIDYQLWVMLDHLRYMIFKARKIELARYNISPEQAQILYTLGRINSLTINEMVAYTQHEHHSISTLINRMAKKGLVNKVSIPGKGRRLKIVITEKGRETLGTMSRDSFGKIFACLSVEDKQEMIVHLCRLIVSSYRALGKEYTPLCIRELELAVTSVGLNPLQ
jgi:DNA-binding MarR family transcriptional regulator